MTPKEIKLLLQLRDIEHQKLAKEIGLTKSEFSKMIKGERVYAEARKKMANRLGMPVDELFGPTFDAAIAMIRKAA